MGKEILNFNIAYQSYGKLNKDKSNAILLGYSNYYADQYVASQNLQTKKPGWWNLWLARESQLILINFLLFALMSLVVVLALLDQKRSMLKLAILMALNFQLLLFLTWFEPKKL